jgi:hypothetical protein
MDLENALLNSQAMRAEEHSNAGESVGVPDDSPEHG